MSYSKGDFDLPAMHSLFPKGSPLVTSWSVVLVLFALLGLCVLLVVLGADFYIYTKEMSLIG